MNILPDATSPGAQTTGTNLSFTHTCSGLERILWVSVVGDTTTDDISSVTYNGVAMTQAVKVFKTRWMYLYYLVAPAVGANTVSITFGSSHYIAGGSSSYTGAAQTGQPDATGSTSGNTLSSIAPSLTVVTANSWLVGLVYKSGSVGLTAGASTFLRSSGDGFNDINIFDSNGARSTGTQALNVNISPSANTGALVASFAPSTALGIVASPATGSGGATMDGEDDNGYGASWASVRSTVQGDGVGSLWNPLLTYIRVRSLFNGSGYYIGRGGMTFDTSAIPAGATIVSAVLSIFGTSTNFSNANSTALVPVAFNPANPGTFVAADWTTIAYTALATAINFSALNQAGYNDYPLNASGIANIVKGGISKFGMITELDRSNTAPASSGNDNIFEYQSADGANPPRLSVVYTLAGSAPQLMMMGVG